MPVDPSKYNNPASPAGSGGAPQPDLGSVIQGALEALQVPGQMARGGAARLISGAITGPTAAIQPPERVAQVNRMWDEGRPAHEIFDELLKTSGPGGTEVPGTVGVSHVVYDPITYLGAGIPGKVGQGLAAAGVSPTVLNAFKFLNEADRVIAQLPWTITKTAVGTPLKVAGKVPLPSAIKITGEGGAKIPAGSIGGLLGSPSANSLYKQKVRDLTDMVASVVNRGHGAVRDVMEEQTFLNVPKAPQNLGAAARLIAQEQGGLLGDVQALKDPQGRAMAMAVYDRVQSVVDDAFKQASAKQQLGQHVRDSQPLYNTALRAIAAGRTLVSRAAGAPQMFGNAAPVLDQVAGRDVFNASEAAFNRIYPAFRAAEAARMMPGGVRGVAGPAAPGAALPLSEWQIAEQTSSTVRAALDTFWQDTQHTGIADTLGGILSPHAELMDMAAARQGGVPAISAIVPERLRQTAIDTFPEFERQMRELGSDRNLVGKALKEVWTRVRPGEQFPADLPTSPLAWMEIDDTAPLLLNINRFITGIGETPITNIVELFQRPTIQARLSARTNNALRGAIERWPEGDLLATNPYLLSIDRLSRQYSRQYGVNYKGLGGALRDATALYKELQLGANPGYLVTNLMSIFAGGAFEGVSPLKVAGHFFSNFGSILRNQRPDNPDILNMMAATGGTIPHSVRSGAGIMADISATKEFLGRGVTASARVGPLKMGVAGAAIGAAAGGLDPGVADEDRAKSIAGGALTGATLGAAFPAMSEILLHRIAAGMETAAREDAFMHSYVSGVARRLPDLYALMDNALAETKYGIRNVTQNKIGLGQLAAQGDATQVATQGARRAVGPTGIPPATQAAVRKTIEARGGLVHPTWVSEQLQKAGVAADSANDVAKSWRTLLDGASVEGESLAAKIHVDYEKLNNFEEFMRWAAPFSTWAIRMTPFYAEHVLTRPAVLLSLMAYAQHSEGERQAQNLPSRFIGSAEFSPVSALVSGITGRPIRVFYNPARGFMPFSDVARFGATAQQEDNPFATAYKVMTSLGPQPHPLAEFALRTGGTFGTDEPARNLFSFGPKVEGLTGIDLNLPARAGEGALRHAITGRSPTDLDTASIARRVEELAVRNLGYPPKSGDSKSDPFLRSLSTQQGPIWEQARKEVAQEQGVRAGLGTFGQVAAPQAFLTPEEASVRMAKKTTTQGGSYLTVDPKVGDGFRKAISAGRSQEPAPPELSEPVRQLAVQAFGPEPPYPIDLYLKANTIGSMNVVREMVASAQIQQNPMLAGFSSGGSPEESQLSAALEAYNSPGSIVQGLSPDAQKALTDSWRIYRNAGPALGRRLIQDKSPTGYWLQQASSARDAYRAAHPMLDQYLSYLEQTNGEGTTKDFFERYWQK